MFMMVVILKGVVGVFGFMFVILFVMLVSVGLLLEGLVFIVGVDCIMDMGCMVFNVVGNVLVFLVIVKWEG